MTKRLSTDSASDLINPSLLNGYLFPLIELAIVEGRATEVSGHEAKQVDLDRSANVTDAAITLLTKMSEQLDWAQFQKLINQYMALMVTRADEACIKSIIRVVCALLEVVAVKRDKDNTGKLADELVVLLTTKAVPNLKEKLIEGETVRAPVAMALVKIFKLLPEGYIRVELPRTLQIVCNLLRLRLQRLRDGARSILAEMTAELGPIYLPFVVQVLKTSLPSRGFTAHVLGYTFHDVLKAVVPEARKSPGCLDVSLTVMVQIIEVCMHHMECLSFSDLTYSLDFAG